MSLVVRVLIIRNKKKYLGYIGKATGTNEALWLARHWKKSNMFPFIEKVSSAKYNHRSYKADSISRSQ